MQSLLSSIGHVAAPVDTADIHTARHNKPPSVGAGTCRLGRGYRCRITLQNVRACNIARDCGTRSYPIEA